MTGLTSVVRKRLTDRRELNDALGIPFSEQQLDAITAPLEPGVIIAGAGSGKTTVMAARVVWLVGTGVVRPEQVLGLTFTRKAAGELSGRIRSALIQAGVLDTEGVDEAGEQVVMTYDAFAARLVSEHGLRIGVDGDQLLISGATRYRLASRVVANAAGPFESLSRLRPATLAERVLKLDAELQAHLVDRDALDRHARQWLLAWAEAPLTRAKKPYADVRSAQAALGERLELASLVADYQELKHRLGVVEFADQMAVAARLVQQVPEVAVLVRDQFRVVLLDEYQDTSAAQAALLQGLFSGPDAAHGRGHPVTAVGDPCQAIYGWRGAAASNILQFVTDFPGRDGFPAQSFALTVNRRSGHRILEVANQLAAGLRGDPVLAEAAGDSILVAPAGAPAGEVSSATFDTWSEELVWVADRVVGARTEGQVEAWSDIAVLTRRNADIGGIYGELTSRDVPVEIVGLGGLLNLPEVRDVVATLRVLDDVTANPELLRLLAGPRWGIGPRDLALLGQRARDMARYRDSDEAVSDALLAALEGAVAEIDPTEVISLLDAVTDPGMLPYSPEARERFAAFATELADLRAHADEPVLDLTRRVIATLGLDVELVATPHFARIARRNQLAVFVDAVADYVDVDGDASLGGLLAYLQAEEEQGTGLDQATPSDSDSVKLLTVHKAKGLEWTMVFLPALVKGVFPSDRVTDNWLRRADAVPADLRGDAESIPQVSDASKDGIAAYAAALKQDQRHAEDRLGYVAVTRAKRFLIGSAHRWRPDTVRPRELSPYLTAIQTEAEIQGRVLATAPQPEPGQVNPLQVDPAPVVWPRPLDPDAQARRHDAALAVAAARERRRTSGDYELPNAEFGLLDEAETIAGWDDDVERLLAEARAARRGRRSVPLPHSLSATGLLTAARDPASFAGTLIRPMPEAPSPAARFGTRFHQWIERHYAAHGAPLPLVDADDFLERDEEPAADDREFKKLCERFARGAFGQRVPHRMEVPFVLMIDGLALRGRIDAIYRSADPAYDWQVIDWKTGRADATDPGQLALYRRAWAQLEGIPEDRVDAAFYLVWTDEVVRPSRLPDPADLVRRTLR
ncbi:MAG TPA: ATP-dependent helicase [Propionibacterium sp.]|jgi:DNA helicase-2/ATP-dependent DNA helicase PcrA|nr:ATP-dependent helicase [Propionibacterium sp.]